MATAAKDSSKNSSVPAKKNKSTELATDFVQSHDPTQEPGHRKMNLKNEFGQATADQERSRKASSVEAVTRSENIRRNESAQRRVPESKGK